MIYTLRVYKGKDVEKTYKIEDTFITSGVCMDVFRVVDVDTLVRAGSDSGMAIEMARSVIRAFMDFYPIVKEIFPDITEDEYRRTVPRDVGSLMMGIIQYAFGQLAHVESEKNRSLL